MIQAFANSCLTLALVVLTQGPPPAGPPQTQPTPTTPPSPVLAPAPLPWRPLPSPVGDDAPEDAVAIHVKRAITVSGEPIDDATILVRGGKIAAIGKLVDVPKGARHLDYSEWTAMPGLVVPLSRAGYVMKAPPQGAATKGRDGIDPRAEIYGIAAKAGITTMAVVPPGTGIVGQASVIRTVGKDLDGMVRRDDAYLFSTFEMSTTAKDQLRQAFDKARETMEQMEKASKEAPAPAPASAPAAGPPAPPPATGPATQPAAGAATRPALPAPVKPDARTEVLIKVLKKEKALWTQVGTGGGGFGGGSGASTPAAEIVHFNDAMKKFELDRVYYGGANAALVVDAIKDVKARMVMPAEESTFEPYTRFRLNGAEELRRAGVSVAFVPNADTPDGYKNWLYKAGQMVRYGFPAKDALRALTLTPAEFLGLADQVGSLAAGREADILFLDGPPFDVSTKVRNVMIAGELVPMEEGQ